MDAAGRQELSSLGTISWTEKQQEQSKRFTGSVGGQE